MILHDFGDIFLHIAKAGHYAQVQLLTDVVFALFALVFFVTRLVFLPFIIYSIWY
jgi:hypothetical protein